MTFNPQELKKLYIPPPDSHKGQNGKLLIIGGSHLFHSASLWALTIASRIVDMVFYSSVPENNEIVQQAKKEFHNGIVVPRDDIEHYIEEADAVLIGPGMMRTEVRSGKLEVRSLKDINKLEDEGLQSHYLTKYLLEKYPKKKWVIDAGALQMMEPSWLEPLEGRAILTPHPVEFKRVFHDVIASESEAIDSKKIATSLNSSLLAMTVEKIAKQYNCLVLLKGQEDLVCSPEQCVTILGGNAGMTKGGTGDVLSGLVAALACKNDLFLAATAGAYINKQAGEALFKKVGYYFNASDLADEIPIVMKEILIDPNRNNPNESE